MAEIAMKKSTVNRSITFLILLGKKRKESTCSTMSKKVKEYIAEERKIEKRIELLIGCYVSVSASDFSEHSVNTQTRSKD